MPARKTVYCKDLVKVTFMTHGREKARKVGLELKIKPTTLATWVNNWSKKGLEEGKDK